MAWRKLLGKKERSVSLDATAGDLMVLAQLEKNGADLTQPRDLVHYLYVPSQDAAEKAATELRSLGYTAEVKVAAGVQPGRPEPMVGARQCGRSRRSRARSMGARAVRRVALKYGGEYDGWEAAV